MKKTLLLTFFVLVPTIFLGNDLSETGNRSSIYPTLEDVRTQTGIYPDIVKITPVTFHQEKPYATTYKAEKAKGAKKFKKFKETLRHARGIACMDTLYINTSPVTKLPGFAKAHTKGRYILIYAPIPNDVTRQKELGIPEEITSEYNKAQVRANAAAQTGVMFGAIGGMIGGAAAAAVSKKAPIVPIVIDTENNVTRCFTPEYAAELDMDYPDIQAPSPDSNGEYPYALLPLYFDAVNVNSEYYKALKDL